MVDVPMAVRRPLLSDHCLLSHSKQLQNGINTMNQLTFLVSGTMQTTNAGRQTLLFTKINVFVGVEWRDVMAIKMCINDVY